MPRHTVSYLNGETVNVTADLIERSGSDYLVYRDDTITGYIPSANVLSILRQDDETKAQPHQINVDVNSDSIDYDAIRRALRSQRHSG